MFNSSACTFETPSVSPIERSPFETPTVGDDALQNRRASLDLDFDLFGAELAPIELLLQRLGRGRLVVIAELSLLLMLFTKSNMPIRRVSFVFFCSTFAFGDRN